MKPMTFEGQNISLFSACGIKPFQPAGTVQTAKVTKTGGSEILDKKAIQTIIGLSGQYPALGKTFELSIPIAFSLKKL